MAKPVKTTLAELVLRLDAPGMTPIHRAGLGGLASTLASIGRAARARPSLVSAADTPGHPWPNTSTPPWQVDAHQITLRFGDRPNPREFLRRLFAHSFQIRDGIIFLPGQYGPSPPPPEVRAFLQEGLTLTFLQHGKSRGLAKESRPLEYDAGEQTVISLNLKPCSWFQHQRFLDRLWDDKKDSFYQSVEIAGPLNPGAVVRHVAFTSATRIEEPPENALALCFAMVGCLALPIRHSAGIVLIPEIRDLAAFARYRPAMTPRRAMDCLVAGAGDAALQAQVRLRASGLIDLADLPGCHAIRFGTLPWSKQQKSRTDVLRIAPGGGRWLEDFEVALLELAPRIVSLKPVTAGAGEKTKPESRTKGGARAGGGRAAAFWSDSAVRPLVADNLARRLPWYRGFSRLMTATEDQGNQKKPIRDRIAREKRGLNAMIKKMTTDQPGEARLVEAVHAALRCRYGQIAGENRGNPIAMKRRFGAEYDRWRLAFAGAKTADQFRGALADMFSRAGPTQVLQDSWQELLPMLAEGGWQLSRDLALVGLASYAGAEAPPPADDSQTDITTNKE